MPSFIARALILFEIYGGGALCALSLPPGSETQKKPRQNRVKNSGCPFQSAGLLASTALS